MKHPPPRPFSIAQLQIAKPGHGEKHSVNLSSKSVKNVGEVAFTSQKKNGMNITRSPTPVFHRAATNRKTLTMYNMSHNEKHAEKISSKSVKSFVHKKIDGQT